MSATIRVRLNRLPEISKAVERKVEGALLAGAQVIEGAAKLKIQTGPKTGRIYKKTKTGALHQASAPGEAPATDTGNLVGGISSEKAGRLKARTIATSEYATALEFGSVDGKMLARPFMKPSADESEGAIQELVAQAVKDGVK